MAMPTLRHATTADGVRIAFYAVGDGPAVVMLFPYHVNHLALNWEVALHRGAIEFFARYFTVINLDFRGAGLSERRIGALSLATFAAGLDAVLATLGMERVALLAIGPATVVACSGEVSAIVVACHQRRTTDPLKVSATPKLRTYRAATP